MNARQLKRIVYAGTVIDGVHCWPEAPEQVKFLRHPHRHRFHIRVDVEVAHNERDVEFLMLKDEIEFLFRQFKAEGKMGTASCETMAEFILERMNGKYKVAQVEVSEDGENGAILCIT